MKTYYSHGKLLLTAEYFVLDGAKGLALPTQKGQSLTIGPSKISGLHWKSLLPDGTLWFETVFNIPALKAQTYKDNNPTIQTLGGILQAVLRLKPNFLDNTEGLVATAHLEFNRDWGLGSSSTLLSNIATWAQIDAYKLLSETFGGSGYDIACAKAETAITYQRTTSHPIVTPVVFNPVFKKEIFFVHLNKKQNSRESIAQYRAVEKKALAKLIAQINEYTEKMLQAKTLDTFSATLQSHEALLSGVLQTPTVQNRLFPTYQGVVKSLGGWGGDFVMATGTPEDMTYFKELGYETIITFEDMIL